MRNDWRTADVWFYTYAHISLRISACSLRILSFLRSVFGCPFSVLCGIIKCSSLLLNAAVFSVPFCPSLSCVYIASFIVYFFSFYYLLLQATAYGHNSDMLKITTFAHGFCSICLWKWYIIQFIMCTSHTHTHDGCVLAVVLNPFSTYKNVNMIDILFDRNQAGTRLHIQAYRRRFTCTQQRTHTLTIHIHPTLKLLTVTFKCAAIFNDCCSLFLFFIILFFFFLQKYRFLLLLSIWIERVFHLVWFFLFIFVVRPLHFFSAFKWCIFLYFVCPETKDINFSLFQFLVPFSLCCAIRHDLEAYNVWLCAMVVFVVGFFSSLRIHVRFALVCVSVCRY